MMFLDSNQRNRIFLIFTFEILYITELISDIAENINQLMNNSSWTESNFRSVI